MQNACANLKVSRLNIRWILKSTMAGMVTWLIRAAMLRIINKSICKLLSHAGSRCGGHTPDMYPFQWRLVIE